MARNTISVIQALRQTALNLEKSADYQWGHMGSCNCGFLAQVITGQSKSVIHTSALQRYGDWNEQLNDYCPTSGYRMDDLVSEMLAFGFDADDLRNLEKLSDRDILRQLPPQERNLRHNVKADVVRYLRAWSAMIESSMIGDITLSTDDFAPAADNNERSLSLHYSD